MPRSIAASGRLGQQMLIRGLVRQLRLTLPLRQILLRAACPGEALVGVQGVIFVQLPRQDPESV